MTMELPFENPLFWCLAIIGVLLTGISKSGFAGGAGVVAVPLLALVMPIPQSTALMLPLLLAMDVRTIGYYRKHVSFAQLKYIVPTGLMGVICGGLLMGYVSGPGLKRMLGIVSIVFALWQSLTPYLMQARGAGLFWSLLSGITSTLIHAGGPPINIYLIGKNLDMQTWLATASIYFGILNLAKIVPYSMLNQWNYQLLTGSLLLLPVALAGVKLGHWIQGRMPEHTFSKVCRFLLLLSGVLLVTQ